MRASPSSCAPKFSQEASRYHYEVPDYDLYPDPYNRTRILLDWVGKDKRVLELGCSTGYMSKYMAEKQNCSVVGVELDPIAAKNAEKYCSEVLVRDLNRDDPFKEIKKQSFDVVLMGDVLEHLVDSQSLLIQVKELLNGDAKIVVCLPNVLHWITRINLLMGRFDYEDAGTLDHTHLRFFTAKSSRQLIESAGYQITKFYPAFGGSLSGYARPIWQKLADWLPGLFAFQFLFEARPLQAPERGANGSLNKP